ncbi:MAG: HAMP domain-containing histidine kinase [Lachnospiraceae bacterium]|nr:HAMP domain-containing histidine kinase [Lachnospiraceae bacterium]
MIRNNKELKRSLLLLSGLCLALTVCGFLHSSLTGLLVLAAGIAVCLVFLLTEISRYKKLQSFSEHLNELLQRGMPLPIRDYEEGELSVLANDIQKITLLLKERADALQKDKSFLADALADISHQLRTPLTTMNLTIGLLQEKDLSEEHRAALTRELNTLLARTEWLVEVLLKLSRLDAGAVVMAKEDISVRKLTEKAAEPLQIPLELRGITLTSEDGEAFFSGDLNWTAEALGNILRNSANYTPEGGSIRIRAEENALFTVITVTDSGPGIAAEDLPHLFDRFYKGRGSSENSYGIGLALAQKIIHAQGGTLRAFNTAEGACFEIKFYKQVL